MTLVHCTLQRAVCPPSLSARSNSEVEEEHGRTKAFEGKDVVLKFGQLLWLAAL